MEIRSFNPTPLLLMFGLAAFVVAGLSIVDMLQPRPYDGVVLDETARKGVIVREVIPGSGADLAGIRKGDRILGIARSGVHDAAQAARRLNELRIGDRVPYLVATPGQGPVDKNVTLGRRTIADGTYLYVTVLGFSFFLVGLFVLVFQPGLRASQVFFLLCGLFLLFLVCRMRPPSYVATDTLILGVGTLAFLFLPPAFLHFYLIFPRPAFLEKVTRQRGKALRDVWHYMVAVIYLLPSLLFAAVFALASMRGQPPQLVNGAPNASWILLAIYMLLGLAAMGGNARQIRDPHQRRGVVFVLIGSLFGLVPFLVSTVMLAAQQQSQTFFFAGIMPLLLVPITFTYAIVRFQLLNIRVILRRGFLYTVTTALLTGIYAGGIATFNAFFSDMPFVSSRYFPIVLALTIALLFEPLRRRMQDLIDRYFFASRARMQQELLELGSAMTAEVDLQVVVHELVERLPQVLDLHFAALYLRRGKRLVRTAGPESLPARLRDVPEMLEGLKRTSLMRLEQLGELVLTSPNAPEVLMELDEAGVDVVGDLASPRRHIGLLMLSAKRGQTSLEADEIELLKHLVHQVSLGLETSLLLEERMQQAELERELQIAATIQAQLLPEELAFAEGWQVSAVCRPARIVGGDFFAQLPSPNGHSPALVFGDVSGKSVSGALMMMAAHEALHALAMTPRPPAELFNLTNRRLYGLGRHSFVALGYFCASEDARRLCYLVAGQPPPLLRRVNGKVSELPLPKHRIPVGAMPDGKYHALEIEVGPGDLVIGYSDGITEARAPNGEFFGTERLFTVLQDTTGGPDEVIAAVLAAVGAFSGDSLQYDDLTLVAVQRTGQDGVRKEGEGDEGS